MDTSKHILIVEDDPLLRQLYATKLADQGYQVSVAVNGQDGFEQAQGLRPDLILLDILMPKVDGLTMLKMIRSDSNTTNIPVIIMTNTPSLPSAHECRQLGIIKALFKINITPSQLATEIQEYFKNQ